MTRNRCFPLTIACCLIWALIMSKSFVQLYFGEGGKDGQVRLRQSKSIIELTVDGKQWENKQMSPSDVVFIENSNKSEDTLSIMNHYSGTSVEMGNNDILGENNENKKVGSDNESSVDENDQLSNAKEDIVIQGDAGSDSTDSIPSTAPQTQSIPSTSAPTQSIPSTTPPTQSIPSTTPPQEPISSSTSTEFSRHAINTKPRTPYNDVLVNIQIKTPKIPESVNQFNQSYTLSYYQDNQFSSQSSPTIQPYLPSAATPDFTIATQTSQERLFFLPYLLDRWQGSYSIVIYCSPEEVPMVQQYLQSQHFPSRLRLLLYVHISSTDCVNKYINNHIQCIPQSIYPINRLRNLAIQNILTTHFILFDMDMWPSKTTYQTLQALPSAYLHNPSFVTIIPAFSLTSTSLRRHPCNGFEECVLRAIPLFPETKKELALCVKKSKCSIFRPLSRTHEYLSDSWYSLDSSSHVKYLKCFKQAFMEPYVMVRRTEQMPLLNEIFINYGFNKVEWIENLRYLGYEFYVLSQGFAMDIPHELSSIAKNYTKSFGDTSPEMLGIYRRFLNKMRKEYPDQSRQLLCLSKHIDLTKNRK